MTCACLDQPGKQESATNIVRDKQCSKGGMHLPKAMTDSRGWQRSKAGKQTAIADSRDKPCSKAWHAFTHSTA